MGNGQEAFLLSSTKLVDLNKGDAKQPEYRSRLCGKELKRWDPDNAKNFCINGTTLVRDVFFSPKR